ncbi:hypothetical protein GC105_10685 [Alkalibaculum sp. M08DMB]|uniref:Scaffolding protein n=1 Tax=Alkalibaculum sporogenes TaxID=2655001 RepID=A0A6A7K9Z6_9FIRM|nr:phage scaffolding protein [Alkalibaculum sporogenes]MPW26254.1 hypothetical protein [Alkalibaculum sporogenes]
MEWIKAIMKKHIKADGTVDMEAAMKEIDIESPKHAVPKTAFLDIDKQLKEASTTIKERDVQISELTKVDPEKLQETINTLQADNKKKDDDYKSQLKELKISNAIKLAIADKAQDADLVAGLFDKEKLVLDGDKIVGLDDQLKGLQESKSFLFKQDDTQTESKPTFSQANFQKQPAADQDVWNAAFAPPSVGNEK